MPLRKAVEFQPNTPVRIALKYGQGKIIPTRNGADRVMFTLDDERVLFLGLGPAQKVNELKLKAREPFLVTKVWSGRRNDAAAWTIERSPEAEKARVVKQAIHSGTAIERQLAGSLLLVDAKKANGAGSSAPAPSDYTDAITTQRSKPSGWAVSLLSQTKELIDVYAQACEHAAEKDVPPAVVRSLLLSSFINVSKGGHC